MDSNPFKRHNILIDYKNKKIISPQPNFKNMPKSIIKKIKNIDSCDQTKDEIFNKNDKNIDKKDDNSNNNIILLRNNKYIKRLKLYSHTSNRDSKRNLHNSNNNVITKNMICRYLNKNDINYLLNSRGKTLEEKLNKKNKFIFNILNNGESEQREHNTKKINSHDLQIYNDNDLINQLKLKKFIRTTYNNNSCKTEIYRDYFAEGNQKRPSRIKDKTDITNIFIRKKLDNSKNILYPLQNKMKTYTNISEIIRSNTINKKSKGKKLNLKDGKNKIKNIKKKLINKGEINNIIDNNNNNRHNLIDNDSILEERVDFQDIPQRRPGCSGDKNITIINDTNYLNNKNVFKKYELNKILPNTTFTKSTRTSKLINNNYEIKGKYNININYGLTKKKLKKFQTDNLHKEHDKNKKKIHKYSKNKHIMYYINLNNHIPRNNDKLMKYLNFNLIDSNLRNDSGLLKSLKNNNSFSSEISNHKNKKQKNSLINSLNIKKYIDKVIKNEH
jgi:hypothetical protein